MLVLRTSNNISNDIARNYSTYAMTRRFVDSSEEYAAFLAETVENRGLGEFVLEMEIVEAGEGAFALKHHDGLASCELDVDRDYFEGMSVEEKTAYLQSNTWESLVGEFESGQAYVSFDASAAEMVYSDGYHHVFEVGGADDQEAPHFTFIDAFC